MHLKMAVFCLVLALGCGCTSLPPFRSARSLKPGVSQGSVILQTASARYTRSGANKSGTLIQDDGNYQEVGSVSGEFRGGTQANGLDIGIGAGSLSTLYLDLKYQLFGPSWRQGLAAALDVQLDYFPFATVNNKDAEFSNGFGGSAGLTLGQFLGFADLNLGGRVGTLPEGTLYAYYTLFDVAGLKAPSDNYYEMNASLEFNVSRRVGLSLGGAYRSYVNKSYTYGAGSQRVDLGLPGFFTAALTASFGGQIPMEENEPKPEPRQRRRRAARGESKEQISAARALMSTGHYTEAITVLEGIEKNSGESKQVSALMGYCYYRKQDWTQSLEQYRNALSFDPDDEKLQAFVDRLEKKANATAIPEEEAPLPDSEQAAP